jgi:hypothetical protein
MEDKKNFTFVMTGEQREAITILSEIEDRSLSKIAEYLIWSGFDSYCRKKALPTALEIRRLEMSYRKTLREIGALIGHGENNINQDTGQTATKAAIFDIDVADEKKPKKKKA